MAFQLTPGKLGFKLGDVLVGLQDGSTDVPEAIKTTSGRAHFLQYLWNPDTLSYEVATTTGGAATSYALQVDAASATITYVGEAEPGSATSGAVWRIKRIDTSSGVSIRWADGVDGFSKIWDNRATYTY